MRTVSITEKELARAIVDRDIDSKWVLPVANAAAFDDRATSRTPTTQYVQRSSRAVYEIISQMSVDSLSSSNYDALNAVIDFRNKLLEVGGSANACLAGSIASAIHNTLFHAICHEEVYDLQAIENVARKNRVSLGVVLVALTKDDRWSTRSSSIDLDAPDVEIARECLMKIGVDDFSKGGETWFDAFIKDRASMETRFGRSLLKNGAFLSYLSLFSGLADNQRILQLVLEYEKEGGKPIPVYFEQETNEQKAPMGKPIILNSEHVEQLSKDLDAFLKKRQIPQSLGTFQPISPNQVLRQVVTRCWDPDMRYIEYHLVTNLLDYDESGLSIYYDAKRSAK
jgi:hypothetical protein